MPPGGVRHTLVGFSADLDWRALHFVEPIPENTLCRACGLVCKRTALLPCRHVLCETCYEQCAQDAVLACPLDDQRFQDGQVGWTEWSADDILRREVACWNEEAGCEAVMAASEICRHLRHECGHHLASCYKCSARVLRKDMCLHLRSECRNLMMPLASEYDLQLSCKDRVFLSFFTRSMEEQRREMRAFFEQLYAGDSSRDEKLSEMYCGMSTLKETLSNELGHNTNDVKQNLNELSAMVKQNHEISATNMLEIATSQEEMKEYIVAGTSGIENLSNTVMTVSATLRNDLVNAAKHNAERLVEAVPVLETSTADCTGSSQRTLRRPENGLRRAELCLDSCAFFVNDVQSYKEAAVKEGHKFFFFKIVYLRGYCMQPGLKFIKYGDSASFHICFLLAKGCVDEALTWPFKHEIKLSIIHAVKEEVHAITVKPSSSDPQGPVGSDKRLIKVEAPSLNLEHLIRDGYVHNDKLLVKWELLA